MTVIKKINQIKEFSPNFNELKRQPPNGEGYMLPWCIDDINEYLQRFSIQHHYN